MNNKHFKFQKYARDTTTTTGYMLVKKHLPPTTNLYCLAETPPSTIMTVPVTHLASFEHR
jgi:hypothetical protein